MKRLPVATLLTCLSLAANVLLIIKLMTSSSASFGGPIPRLPRLEISGRTSPPLTPRPPAEGVVEVPSGWAWIDSGGPSQWVANLRAVGCPEQTVRDIVGMRLGRVYRERLRAEMGAVVRGWDLTRQPTTEEQRALSELRRDLQAELDAELEAVLGEPAGRIRAGMLGWPDFSEAAVLSSEKRREVRRITAMHEHELGEIHSRANRRALTADERTLYWNRVAEMKAALAAVLSPTEFEDYWYRSSPAAGYVRRALPEAGSEAEYRRMVDVAEELQMMDEASLPRRYGTPHGLDPADERRLEEQEAALRRRLAEVLGEERVVEGERLEQARQEEEARRREEREKQREQARLASMAAEVGVARDAALRFFESLEQRKPELDRLFEELERGIARDAPDREARMKSAVLEHLDPLARETMGDAGPALVRKLFEAEGRP